jgi:hypothetical protein
MPLSPTRIGFENVSTRTQSCQSRRNALMPIKEIGRNLGTIAGRETG